jgi:hypothetical protein
MGIHRLSALAKRSLPSFIWSPARKLTTAFLTPIRFSINTGHFRSSLRAAAVDRRGRPIPWYTYPAIDFLDAKDFADKSVMEFGSGQSTLWWASRAKKVVSAESDEKWLNHVRTKLPTNARAFLLPDDLTGLSENVAGEKFDLIIVDGLNRHRAAEAAVGMLNPGGAILLDNSEGRWSYDGSQRYPILELFRAAGFSRVDFYGHSPGVILPACSSLFFKSDSFIIRGEENVIEGKLPRG